jgi:hypothetical protein
MPGMMRLFLVVTFFVATACSMMRADSPTAIPTPTTVRVVQTTPVPTLNRQMQAVPTAQPAADATEAPTETTPVPACDDPQSLPTASYVIEATLRFREQLINAEQAVMYINRTGTALTQLVFDVEPNRRPGVFTLNSLTLADGTPLPAFELAGRRLTVDLVEPLGEGCRLDLKADFRIKIPQIDAGINGYTGYFGFSARQINLAHWLPAVAVRHSGEWLVHDSVNVGEQTVLDPADWDVTLTVEGASDRLVVVGPGEATEPQPMTWRFVNTGVRDLPLTMSEQYHLLSAETEQGVSVELYCFEDAQVEIDGGGTHDGATHALDVATRALSMYSDLFGDYPRDRFIVVQGDFPDGMEFSDLVFVSGEWFRSYSGQPTSYLTLITIHEVAHQWWYSRVGNDQAMTPWLDESLATYSEYVFYEEYYPDLRDWWWQFRIDSWIPPNFDDRSVASTVYEFASIREYVNAVYLRGARMLRDLRADLGTELFFEWLAKYADAGTDQIATPDLFWSLLTPEQAEWTRETREQYLGTN